MRTHAAPSGSRGIAGNLWLPAALGARIWRFGPSKKLVADLRVLGELGGLGAFSPCPPPPPQAPLPCLGPGSGIRAEQKATRRPPSSWRTRRSWRLVFVTPACLPRKQGVARSRSSCVRVDLTRSAWVGLAPFSRRIREIRAIRGGPGRHPHLPAQGGASGGPWVPAFAGTAARPVQPTGGGVSISRVIENPAVPSPLGLTG